MTNTSRAELMSTLPLTDRVREIAGRPTAVLEGGEGPPLVLLHGPGEFALQWAAVVPELVRGHRVIAPDLPGHGASGLNPDVSAVDWLAELIRQSCDRPPAIVGRVVGGAIGLRYALAYPDSVRHLVLVDTFGLTPFAPEPAFAEAMNRFLAAPSGDTFDGFLRLCLYDLDGVRARLGQPAWTAFEAYALSLARTPSVGAAMGALVAQYGMHAVPPEELATLTVPTTLVWGRHDRATPLRVAQEAAALYGWPLHVVEDAADDPPLDQPVAFVAVLHSILTGVRR